MFSRPSFAHLLSAFCCLFLLAACESRVLTVRKPSVAGSFYPIDSSALNDSVDKFLTTGLLSSYKPDGQLIGVIAPHAGYQYSGAVAGWSYALLKDAKPSTIILLGPSHHFSHAGLAFDTAESWATPIGTVRIDTALQHRIADVARNIKDSGPTPLAFEGEHSMEVQLPFIQRAVPEAQIVPIGVGEMEMRELTQFTGALAQIVAESKGKVMIVASSDMSHYLTYEATRHSDSIAIQDVASNNVDKLIADIQSKDCEFCGFMPVIAMSLVAEHLGAGAHLLRYGNSGDVTADRSRVVGYGAFSFALSRENAPIDESMGHVALQLARTALNHHFAAGQQLQLDNPRFSERRAAFVTLKKNNALRGCIGYTTAHTTLASAISECAVLAATKDPRFPPMRADEMKDVSIEISVLSPLKRIRTIDSITVGTHGLYIRKDGKAGLLLPQVPTEFGWDKAQYLDALCEKASLPKQSWRTAELYTFTAQIFSEDARPAVKVAR